MDNTLLCIFTTLEKIAKGEEQMKNSAQENKITRLENYLSRLDEIRKELMELCNLNELPEIEASRIVTVIDDSRRSISNNIIAIKNRAYDDFKRCWIEVEGECVDQNEKTYIHKLNPNLKIVTSNYTTGNLFIGNRGSQYTFVLQNCNIKDISDRFGNVDLNCPKRGYITRILFGDTICYKKDDHIIIPFTNTDGFTKYYSLYGNLIQHGVLPDNKKEK